MCSLGDIANQYSCINCPPWWAEGISRGIGQWSGDWTGGGIPIHVTWEDWEVQEVYFVQVQRQKYKRLAMRKSLNLISIWKSSAHLRSCKLFLPSWALRLYLLWFFSPANSFSLMSQHSHIRGTGWAGHLSAYFFFIPPKPVSWVLQVPRDSNPSFPKSWEDGVLFAH